MVGWNDLCTPESLANLSGGWMRWLEMYFFWVYPFYLYLLGYIVWLKKSLMTNMETGIFSLAEVSLFRKPIVPPYKFPAVWGVEPFRQNIDFVN